MTLRRSISPSRGLPAYLALGAAMLLGGPEVALALPSNFQEVVVFQGFVEPSAVRFSRDGRVFVAEKAGLIKVFDGLADPTPTIVADLRTNVHGYWDRGLLGMALHPDFPATPYLYVLYTYDFDPLDPAHPAPRYGDTCPDKNAAGDIIGPGAVVDGCVVNARLSRLKVNPNNTLDGGEQVLIENRWCQQYPSHSVGSLVFGPEGALYASAGDAASFYTEDWGQFGGARPGISLPTPANPCADPNTPRGTPTSKPDAEGGSLRAQGVRTPANGVSLDGSVIRIDPATGAAWPTNPLIGGVTTEDDPIIAYGLRNPFRITVRPGTGEIWLGDVGQYHWEEINRIPNPDDPVAKNFGWPCLEGPERSLGFNQAAPNNLNLCSTLATGDTTPAYFAYPQAMPLYEGDPCNTTSGSSVSGLAFYTGGAYPPAYNGALFFADWSRNCVWVMTTPTPGGDPVVASRTVFLSGVADAQQVGSPRPVDLQIGPGGDLFFVDFSGGKVRRIMYNAGNSPPTAVIQASPTNGPLPLTVQFDASASADPDPGATLFYAWDIDGDGQFDDAFLPQASYTYVSAGDVQARLRVTDDDNASTIASTTISPGNSAPTATITAPLGTVTWRVGDPINFAGTGNDPDQGSLAAASMHWDVLLHHCVDGPATCHTHNIQAYEGISQGTFTAPDHPYYSELEFVLTVTDSGGLSGSASVTIAPVAVINTYESTPPGATLSIAGFTRATTFTRGSIVGSFNSLIPASPQVIGGANHYFVSWSDGGPASRTFTQDQVARTYHANFAVCQASETVCDGLDNDCDGTIDDVPPPAGVPGFSLQQSGMSWTALPDAATYDVVRGSLSALHSGFTSATRECLANDLPALSLSYPGTPPLGDGFWFLVRGKGCAAPGTWDAGDPAQAGSCDAAINASPFSCSGAPPGALTARTSGPRRRP